MRFVRRKCSRRFAKFCEQALDALPQGVRVAGKRSVGLREISCELDVDEEFQVRAADHAFPLAAVEKGSQQNGSFERRGNSPNNIVDRHDRFVAFGIAGNARFAFRPFERGAFGHARNGKRQGNAAPGVLESRGFQEALPPDAARCLRPEAVDNGARVAGP